MAPTGSAPAQFCFFFQFRGEVWIGVVLLVDMVLNVSTAYEVHVTDLNIDETEPSGSSIGEEEKDGTYISSHTINIFTKQFSSSFGWPLA